MRKFIWICDRCGAGIEPRVLDKGEMYITRKKGDDDIINCREVNNSEVKKNEYGM